MSPHLTLYTRRDCCLCEEMKKIIAEVAGGNPPPIEEVDVDSSPDLQQKYGDEVPVLVINGRKAFKYRVTAKELEKRLRRETDSP